MRIDYSPPKQSYVNVTGQSKPRPRKEPVGKLTGLLVLTGLIAFSAGFGGGWFLSQQSAKKAFQAATEQSSLESAPKPAMAPPAPTPLQAEPAPPAATPPPAAAESSPAAAAPEPQLSFYKTLPAGQKTNLMGSGVNAKEEKQPLQAAIPSNVARKAQSPPPARQAPETPAAAEKPAPVAREASGYTVQAASYSLKSEAEALRGKLAAKGYNAIINESNQGDKGVWYRVRVGRKLEQEAARELADKIGKGAIAVPERE